jgi:hypothetical protein
VTPPHDAAYYEDLRGRMRGVLIQLGAALSTEDAALLDELIDANEPGVALEILVDALMDASTEVPSEARSDMANLADIMGMTEVAEKITLLSMDL